MTHVKKTTSLLTGVTVMLGSLFASPMVAVAQPVETKSSTESSLQALDLLAPAQVTPDVEVARGVPSDLSGDVGASLSTEAGLMMDGGDHVINIAPGTSTDPGVLSDSGALIYETSDAFDYAFTGPGAVNNAGYIVIEDETAPTEYRFDISVDGAPAQLAVSDDSVIIQNAAGETVNVINPAWAVDSVGADIPTSYTVEGGTLVQHVDHLGASYPVVADPSLACNLVWCTVMLDRTETQTASQSAAAAGGLICGTMTAALAPLGVVCAVYAAAFYVAAVQANNSGECVGMRMLTVGGSAHPVIEPC